MAEDVKELDQAKELELAEPDKKELAPKKTEPTKKENKPTGPMSPDGLSGKDFLDAFGDYGARMFTEGKTFHEAASCYIVKLEEEIQELKTKLSAVDKGLETPVSTDNQSDADAAKQAKMAALSEKIGNSRARFAADINL